jgi:5-methylcytosine-specific restriction endonuclease McrA
MTRRAPRMRQGPPNPYNQRRYRDLKRRFIARSSPACAICGEWLDRSLSGNHPMGPTVDHRFPTSAGGAFWDLGNWQLAHRRCNTSKGDRVSGRFVASGAVADPRYPPVRLHSCGLHSSAGSRCWFCSTSDKLVP